MVKRRHRELDGEAHRRAMELCARLGGEVRRSRRWARQTQAQLGERVGLGRSTISSIELGHGGGHTLETWQRLSFALDRNLVVHFDRDPREDPADAGHLGIQELVLRLGRAAGYRGAFELATRPADPSRSVDVGLRDDVRRILIFAECWNTIGDLGAGARSSARKLAEAGQFAIAIGVGRPHRVAGCWVIRATRRNRDLVARYPEVFASRFPGSSLGWVRALTLGLDPPVGPGLIWCDVRGTRLFPWRRDRSHPAAVL